ncbi:MAG: response regulator [Candidatus Orphnella occulta]|nr:response regulator [Candidatus Orphnella occulta]
MPFDKSKFIERFRAETKEHIEKLNLGLLGLEKSPKDEELLNFMMREAHTIKGSAIMMGFKRIAELSHTMESGLEKALKGDINLKKVHFDALFAALDLIEPLLDDKVTWQAKGIERPYVESICRQTEDAFSGKIDKIAGEVSAEDDNSLSDESGKVASQDEIESGLKKGSSGDKIVADHVVVTEDSIRVSTDRLDKIVNLSGELLISKIRLNEVVNNIKSKIKASGEYSSILSQVAGDISSVNENIDFLTTNMQQEVIQVRMVPVSYLFNTFPRAMRDLARKKGKDINFFVKGEDTQLDKVIIDDMRDPIMHLLRNALDHGLEAPEVRIKNGKPAEGNIFLSAYQEGSHVAIEVTDDGKGIDIESIKHQAVKKGLVSQERIDSMVDEQIYQLIFIPGFSTREDVSETSGRGVGLDVVRESVSKLKGMVDLKTKKGEETSFILKVPLTLAITESLLVAAGSDLFSMPIDSVVETIRISSENIKKVETKDAITVRGHIIPLVRLNDIFGLPTKGIVEKRFLPVVVVQSAEKRVGILVEELMGRQEIIAKAIGDPLKNIANITGATILGSGKVILILDIPSIIESAEGMIIKRSQRSESVIKTTGKKRKTILLAEDVLSTAMLQKNILESVGYSVVIAHDGKEALDKASQETFDLVITDVLMPRMDGFELVETLRKNKMYKDAPIIIVTSRQSDQDKRRGLEAGADAYILKSEFTSEGLLNTLERLMG